MTSKFKSIYKRIYTYTKCIHMHVHMFIEHENIAKQCNSDKKGETSLLVLLCVCALDT